MHTATLFTGDLILPDRIVEDGAVMIRQGCIEAVGDRAEMLKRIPPDTPQREWNGRFLGPGYVDLHMHGGGGADFMDGTDDAFRTVLTAHARHGTTSVSPTTTAAGHDQILTMLDTCRRFFHERPPLAARVIGSHFYGPYFSYDARGCHPPDAVREPRSDEYLRYLDYADVMVTATIAPELPRAENFVRACIERGVRTNVGHSHATFEQMAAAVRWGVRHVDHLYCAMSDKSKLRASQPYPMRGGVLEATLYFDELTTEIIADGKHLDTGLLLLARKVKRPDRLALVTDCNRALDMPEGRYVFGPLEGGEPFDSRDGVGIMPDGSGLASSVRALDHMVRTYRRMTDCPIWEAVRMASLTPARIAGRDQEVGSIQPGRRADLLILDRDLEVEEVFIDGVSLMPANERE